MFEMAHNKPLHSLTAPPTINEHSAKRFVDAKIHKYVVGKVSAKFENNGTISNWIRRIEVFCQPRTKY